MKYVLLLRGINVGGHGKLPMADLSALLAGLGARDVATYIQSGNAVFSGDFTPRILAAEIEDRIEAQFGFRRDALVLTGAEILAARAGFPFAAAFDAPKTGHVSFLKSPAQPDLGAMQALAAPDEEFRLAGQVFYLYAPSGIGRSKLAAKVEKLLGVLATARNLNSVRKLCEMVEK